MFNVQSNLGFLQLVILTLEQRLHDGTNIVSVLNLGDLAGSERVKKSAPRSAFVDDVLDELDSRQEVGYVREIMRMGTGADRQLRVYAESGGDLMKVMDYIIEETSVGLDVAELPERKVG